MDGTLNFYRLRQTFPRPRLERPDEAVWEQLRALRLDRLVRPGQKVGVTVGSRGIQDIVPILRAAVAYLRRLGAAPCLLAAMGSHGGGSIAGQMEVLESLGVSEASVGAPVAPCAASEIVGRTASGIAAYTLRSALEMDWILPVNRVKVHTSFKGPLESGLIKMLVVGLGGPAGARQFHNLGSAELAWRLPEIGRALLEKLPLLGGIAIVENAFEETAVIEATPAAGMIEREQELLAYARTLLPSLPADELDLLIVEEMGKNYSGVGMDTNIIGRIRIEGVPEPARPAIQRIAALDLSKASHGNAHGVGLADFVTDRLVGKIDRAKTYLNSLTSTFVIRSAIPMQFASDRELLAGALLSLGEPPAEKLRAIIIPNTLYLTELLVSEGLRAELQGRPALSWEGGAIPCRFDDAGNLLTRVQPARRPPTGEPR